LVFGGGLVVEVTPPVKSSRFETRFPEVVCTPFTTEAAKVAPGSVGSDIRPPPPEEGAEGMDAPPALGIDVVEGL
jgi:hypothetical protein